jgi:hypothetical protein
VLGRSPQATYCIDDARVSRSHARIDWHGGTFQLTDLSYNGTYVRFGDSGEMLSLRAAAALCTAAASSAWAACRWTPVTQRALRGAALRRHRAPALRRPALQALTHGISS